MSRELTDLQDRILGQLDPSRRHFFRKLMAGTAAAAALPAMSSIVLADDGDKPSGKGKGKADGKGKGKGGGKGKGERPGPAQLAERLIKEHDKDGDKALNVKELTAALEAMRERAQGRGKGGPGKGKGGPGKGKGGPRPMRPE